MALLPYRFRYRDPRTRPWIVARYHAELHVIATQYPGHELIGPPEVRESVRGSFSPSRRAGAS